MKRRGCALLWLALVPTLAQGAADAPPPPVPAEPPPLIREIVFKGNKTTEPKVMLREMDVRVGDPADPVRIERARQGIQDLGLFRSVRVESTPLDGGVRLTYRVKEKIYVLPLPRVDANSDGGYSYGMSLRLDNIGGRNHSMRGHWERRKSAEGSEDAHERGLKESYYLAYTAPYLFDTVWDLDVVAQHQDAPVVKPIEYGETYDLFALALRRKISDDLGSQGWYAGGGLLWKNEDTSGVAAPEPYGMATALVGLASHRDLHYRTYSDEGQTYGGRVEVATEGWASDYHYTQWTVGYARYFAVGDTPHQTVHFLTSVGARHGGPQRDDVEAFSLGGSAGLRGFEPETAEGDFAYTVTGEFLRPMFRNSIRGLVLLEAGNAFLEPGDLDFDRVLVSAGLGVRVRIQAFVNLDLEIGWAWPLNGGSGRAFASKVQPLY